MGPYSVERPSLLMAEIVTVTLFGLFVIKTPSQYIRACDFNDSMTQAVHTTEISMTQAVHTTEPAVQAWQTVFVFKETCVERVDTMAPEKTEFEARKERKQALAKEYRAKNADRIKAMDKAYRAANAERIQAYDQGYYAANPDHQKAKRKAYYCKNAERCQASNAAWKKKNADRIKARDKAYRAANAERIQAYNQAYKQQNLGCVECKEWPDWRKGSPHYDQMCFRCFSEKYPTHEKVKSKARMELLVRAFIDRNFPALVYTRTYTHTHTHTDRNTNTDILIASSASPPHRPSYQASHPSSSCVTDACVTDAGLARSRPASTSFIVLALNILPRLLLFFSPPLLLSFSPSLLLSFSPPLLLSSSPLPHPTMAEVSTGASLHGFPGGGKNSARIFCPKKLFSCMSFPNSFVEAIDSSKGGRMADFTQLQKYKLWRTLPVASYLCLCLCLCRCVGVCVCVLVCHCVCVCACACV